MTVIYVGADGMTRRTYNNITSQEVNGTMVVLGHHVSALSKEPEPFQTPLYYKSYQWFVREATINLAPGERLEWSKDASERG